MMYEQWQANKPDDSSPERSKIAIIPAEPRQLSETQFGLASRLRPALGLAASVAGSIVLKRLISLGVEIVFQRVRQRVRDGRSQPPLPRQPAAEVLPPGFKVETTLTVGSIESDEAGRVRFKVLRQTFRR